MRSILCVDDEPHITRLLRHKLEQAGFLVETARDGMQALEKLSAQRFDVLITDMQMPKLDGRALCERAVRETENAELIIFIVTSRPQRDYREWASQFRNAHFLEKPFSIQRLIEALFEATAQREGETA